MKTKKVIALTIAIVVVVLVGVLGLSRIFEVSWQNTGESENNLNVDESNLNRETIVIDYPYYMLNDYTVFQDKAFEDVYADVCGMYKRTSDEYDYLFKDFTVPQGHYNHQDIANMCGEAIKYLYGRSDLQNNKAVVLFSPWGETDDKVWMARYWYNDEFDIFLSPESGRIKHFECKTKGTSIKPNNPGVIDYETDYFTDDVKLDIEQMIYETISIIAPDLEIVDIEYCSDISLMLNGLHYLHTKITDKNGETAELSFYTNDFDVYELCHYSRRDFIR